VGFAEPYIVPLFFGYKWDEKLVLYFHCAKEGKKLDCLAKNDRVCFEMEADREIKKGAKACGWGARYSSILGTGRMRKAASGEERVEGLNLIMRHCGGPGKNEFDPKVAAKTEVLILAVDEINGKKAL
jgi:nitroimidazol reductase NimA-like FMN-containing flavoprotein (pyridoxamine 5'-phosphate oxidase superfamily)